MQEQRHEQKHDEKDRCEPVRAAARPVFVDVYAHKDKAGNVKFCHDWRLQANGPVKGSGTIEVPFGTPKSPIHFELDDQTGLGLKFPEDADDAIWARVGQCPAGKGDGGQIEFPEAKTQGNGRKLKVDNLNSAACDLHYALRFIDERNNVLVYDPIIKDKGGGP